MLVYQGFRNLLWLFPIQNISFTIDDQLIYTSSGVEGKWYLLLFDRRGKEVILSTSGTAAKYVVHR